MKIGDYDVLPGATVGGGLGGLGLGLALTHAIDDKASLGTKVGMGLLGAALGSGLGTALSAKDTSGKSIGRIAGDTTQDILGGGLGLGAGLWGGNAAATGLKNFYVNRLRKQYKDLENTPEILDWIKGEKDLTSRVIERMSTTPHTDQAAIDNAVKNAVASYEAANTKPKVDQAALDKIEASLKSWGEGLQPSPAPKPIIKSRTLRGKARDLYRYAIKSGKDLKSAAMNPRTWRLANRAKLARAAGRVALPVSAGLLGLGLGKYFLGSDD